MVSKIWTEQYRPKKFNEVMGQEDIVQRIESLTNSMNIPHLLLAGPAGTGKSTLALIIVKELFGEDWKDSYLELNASDERGINIVREKVKNFARTKSLGKIPFKIIFLDEADALTPEAQQALRRTMENYSATCRFILSCNYSSKIIDPIQSRCAIFRFKLLEKKAIEKVLNTIAQQALRRTMENYSATCRFILSCNYSSKIIDPIQSRCAIFRFKLLEKKAIEKVLILISEKEKLTITPEAIEILYEGSEGDCRRSINLLQSSAAISPSITKDLVSTIISNAKPKDIKIVLDYALAGDFQNSREKLLDVMLKESISGQDVIKAIQKEIWNLPVEPEIKVKLTEKTGETEFRIVEGSDPFIQLQALLASFVLAGLGK